MQLLCSTRCSNSATRTQFAKLHGEAKPKCHRGNVSENLSKDCIAGNLGLAQCGGEVMRVEGSVLGHLDTGDAQLMDSLTEGTLHFVCVLSQAHHDSAQFRPSLSSPRSRMCVSSRSKHNRALISGECPGFQLRSTRAHAGLRRWAPTSTFRVVSSARTLLLFRYTRPPAVHASPARRPKLPCARQASHKSSSSSASLPRPHLPVRGSRSCVLDPPLASPNPPPRDSFGVDPRSSFGRATEE